VRALEGKLPQEKWFELMLRLLSAEVLLFINPQANKMPGRMRIALEITN
jgi:hypothetical protein